MNVSMEDAYREACLALGESIVRERLLSQAIANTESERPCSNCGKPGMFAQGHCIACGAPQGEGEQL